jgi:hypothetical protein
MRRRKRVWSFVVVAGVIAASACSEESTPEDPGDAGAGHGDAGAAPASGTGGSSGEPSGDAGSTPSAGHGGSGRGGSAGKGGTAGKGGGDSGAPSTAGEAGRGGSGGDGARAGEGGAGAPGARGPFACKEPRAFDGGYVACATDAPENIVFFEFSEVRYSYLHRPTTGTCPNALSYEGEPGSHGTAGEAGAGGYGWGDNCVDNVDCGRPNYCSSGPPLNYCYDGVAGPLTCRRGCETDEDCGPSSICLCGNLLTLAASLGACVPASCKTDADCEAGYRCASTFHDAYEIRFSCQTAEDECAGNDDCADEGAAGAGYSRESWSRECTLTGSRRTCGNIECAYDWGPG